MAEFLYVELPSGRGPTGSRDRQAAVNAALLPYVDDGWEPVSIAETGAVGQVGVMLRRD